ncbi:MAG: acylase [Candidatus Hydrogenedentota bacterium]
MHRRNGVNRSFSEERFLAGLCLAVALLAGCLDEQDRKAFIPPADRYDVEIVRDTWGIPHVYGKSDADAAYGLAFAHCEDDWEHIEGAVLTARGRMAAVFGRSVAPFDYLVRLFRVRAFVDEKYETGLSPEVRAIVEAYAEGVTHFAALFPGKTPHVKLPVTGKDIVAGATFKAPFFYELQHELRELMAGEGGVPIGRKGEIASLHGLDHAPGAAPGAAFGSNAWAVAPHRSADGAARLAINSHMPWTGPVAWYEAHVVSEAGWNMTGGTFPGGPMIFSGHDAHKGWCHTINRPDLVDIYELDINPEDQNQYWYDGAWRDLERETARFTVKLWGPIRIPVERELLWSVHGPALRTGKGVFAIAFAGYGEVGHLEQWFRMNKARNLDEFIAAMELNLLTSLNTVYADRQGNLFYAYNGHFPVRADGHDWQGVLPGDDPALRWSARLPFSAVPQVLNPPSGFIQSCNNTPFHTTDGPGNPRPEEFPAWMGIQKAMTNRAWRALELYGADTAITPEEFHAYKYDKTYSEKSALARFQREIAKAPLPEDPLLREAVELVRAWDRTTGRDSEAAALVIMAGKRIGLPDGSGDTPLERLHAAARTLHAAHNTIRVRWEDMMRLVRGDLDLGLAGGPDCLRALDPQLMDDGRYQAINGDCLFQIVAWDRDGRVSAENIHQFGAATLAKDSPHYADQAPLFAREKTRTAFFTKEEVSANAKRRYRPGELAQLWYKAD